MTGVAAWLGIIGGAVGLVVFLGATVIYLRGSKDKGTIATLEASNRALLERVEVIEANEQRLTQRVTQLEHENSVLVAQRPSAEAIASIALTLNKHDSDTRTLLRALVQQRGKPTDG